MVLVLVLGARKKKPCQHREDTGRAESGKRGARCAVGPAVSLQAAD